MHEKRVAAAVFPAFRNASKAVANGRAMPASCPSSVRTRASRLKTGASPGPSPQGRLAAGRAPHPGARHLDPTAPKVSSVATVPQ